MNKVIYYLVIIFVCVSLFNSNELKSQEVDFQVQSICDQSSFGSIDITLDDLTLQLYGLPLLGEWENLTTGEFGEFVINDPFYSLTNLQGGEYEIIIDLDEDGSCFFFYQGSLHEIVISLIEIEDECRDFANGSIFVEIEGIGCAGHFAAWSNGDIGNKADNLSAGEYCIEVACANDTDCRVKECFTLGNAPDGCDDNIPCQEILANEVLVTTDFIFFNTSTNTCEGGSFNFDASGSSAYPVTISISSQEDDGCIANTTPISLTQFNPFGAFDVNCLSSNSNACAGKYCFDVERPGCPVVNFCRNIDICRGKSRDSKNIACLELSDGGPSGDKPKKTRLEEIPPMQIGLDREVTIQSNAVSLTLAKVFPNPFTTDIHIQIESANAQNVQVVLMDIYGRTVLYERKELIGGMNLINLQPSVGLASGIYALTVIDQQQKKYTELITRMNN